MFWYRHRLDDCCSGNLLSMITPSVIQNSSLNTSAVNALKSHSIKLNTVISTVLQRKHLKMYGTVLVECSIVKISCHITHRMDGAVYFTSATPLCTVLTIT